MSLIKWSEPCTTVAADPGATLALDRVAWETLGARFMAVDDGQGETPGLARALVRTATGDVGIGILDYGERATYILVPGRGARQAEMTDLVLDALAEAGAISVDADVIDVISATSGSPTGEEATIEDVRRLAKEIPGTRARSEGVMAAPGTSRGRSIEGEVEASQALKPRAGDKLAEHFAVLGLTLTPDEQRVVALVADGRSNRQIATDLSLSLTTVHKHINAVYRKLGVDSRRTVSSAPAAPPPPEPTADASPAPAKPAATESAPAPVASGGSHGHGTIRLRGTPEPAPVAAAAAPPIAPGTVTTADVERLAAEAKAAWAAYQSLSRSPDWQQKSMEMAAAAVRATALELAKRSLG